MEMVFTVDDGFVTKCVVGVYIFTDYTEFGSIDRFETDYYAQN